MGYATQDDLVERFGEIELIQLTDRDGVVGAINTAVVAAKLADADGEIDPYLRSRYALPLATVPQPLMRIACDIARYHLHADRATEQVAQRYKDAIAFLRAVAKGELQLGLDPAAQPAPATGGPEYSAPERVFTRDTLADF